VGFSPADMGPVADSLFEFLCDLDADGSKGMDVGLDVFKAVGDSPEDARPEQRAKDETTKALAVQRKRIGRTTFRWKIARARMAASTSLKESSV